MSSTASEIRPCHFEISEKQIDDLRQRIAETRWRSKELVPDRSARRGGECWRAISSRLKRCS
jgi:hypothetical protein